MFNVNTLQWDKEALEIAGITEEKLPILVPTTHVLHEIDHQFAYEMNISKATPFVVGASDGVLSNLGLNAIKPGVLAVTIGTSGAIRTVSNKPLTDPKGRTFCYALTKDHWVIGGPVNNGGVTFQWARDQFGLTEIQQAEKAGADAYELLTEMAEKIAPWSRWTNLPPVYGGRACANLECRCTRIVFWTCAISHPCSSCTCGA